MQAISRTADGCAPLGHYVPAMRHGDSLHMSATLPEAAAGGASLIGAPFEAQMRQLLANCASLLQAAGSSAQQVVSFTLYLTDLAEWETADRLLADFFGAHRPARSVLCVAAIRKGYAAQASLIAAM